MATGPSYAVILVKLGNRDSSYLADQVLPSIDTAGTQTQLSRRATNAISKALNAIAGGVMPGNLWMSVMNDGTHATGAIACTRANAATDTVTFTYGTKTIVFTEGTDFLRGADDTATGDNLAAAINANSVLKSLVAAVAVTGTITLTARFPTVLGHAITLTTSDATAFALTAMASGTAGTAKFFFRHFQSGATP